MLFILRKLRRSFFVPGKLRTYLAYAIGEIALIVVGILIAVEIGDGNQARKNRAEETEILLKLKVDLADTKANEVETTNQYSNVRDSVMLLVNFIADPSEGREEDELYELLSKALIYRFYKPSMSTYAEILKSGNLTLIRSDDLRQALAGLDEKLKHLETLTQDLFNRWTTVEEPYMVDHIVLSKLAENYNKAKFPDLPFQADSDGFRSREFANILAGRVICIDDIVLWAGRVAADIENCLELIDAELAER